MYHSVNLVALFAVLSHCWRATATLRVLRVEDHQAHFTSLSPARKSRGWQRFTDTR